MKKADTSRRNFMVALGLGSIGATAALLAGKSVEHPAAQTPAEVAPPAAKGYQLSAHVQTYYRKARI